MHSEAVREHLFSPSFKRRLQGYEAIEVLRRYADRAPEHPLSMIQYLDVKTYLVGDILTKVDRASMAHSLEVRVPLLDHELVEWMSGLPPNLKLRGREGKYIFKKALSKYLPAEVLYRPKMGFAVPLKAWFRGPLRQRVRDALLGPILRDTGLFDMNFVAMLVDRHQSGRNDFSAILWALLMFEAFQRRILQSGFVTPDTTRVFSE
jgi:asparagine synthase (glutamine-hydrolysing)